MAHAAQQEFCDMVKNRFPQFFKQQRVLEVGSRNINGSLRTLFSECDYVGLDCTPGPDVDVVCLAHEYQAESNSFDVVASAECLEHDPFAEQTIASILRLLRCGGLCFLTCASQGRAEHGTHRQGKRYGPEANFYRNILLAELAGWLHITEGSFSEAYLRHNPEVGDLYFYGIKT